MMVRNQGNQERGTILLVVLFIASSIAALAAISSGRVVTESNRQEVLEHESQAVQEAFGRLQLAINVINNSPYDAENHNLELRASIAGDHGGTVAGDDDDRADWLHDPSGVEHGMVRGTEVRVYRGRDYVKRLAKLKGKAVTDVDPDGDSDHYFAIEAAGRAGDTIRVVSALVRENEPYSSFVYFQNRHTLGVSGAPRGLIHSNDKIAFYFENGSYVDGVSSVNGFDYKAGATEDNTDLSDANGEAKSIDLDGIDFTKLKENAGLFVGQDGLDAEIKMNADGTVSVDQYTPPRFETVEREYSEQVVVGYHDEVRQEWQEVQIGTTMETRTRTIIVGYETETYTVMVPDYEDREVERVIQVPITEEQVVTRTRWVYVFVPYEDPDAGGGTAVGGDGSGTPGEYQWVQEEYETTEDVIIGYDEQTITVTEQVQVGEHEETREREVPITEEETYDVEVPVTEQQLVEVTVSVPDYETRTWTEDVEEFIPPTLVQSDTVDLTAGAGTMYIDGRITRLYGDLKGRLTIVGNERVRIDGSIRYVDGEGDTAMLHGDNYGESYERNPDYAGNSTLGVVARSDVLYTDGLPQNAEINASLMSVEGRVGIDGFGITESGEPTDDYTHGMSDSEREKERAYDHTTKYDHDRFRRESLRRLGGVISNDRILDTFIQDRNDGTSYVSDGFKRGKMQFDINLLFNPPPNFVEVPRPVLTNYAPVFFTRGDD